MDKMNKKISEIDAKVGDAVERVTANLVRVDDVSTFIFQKAMRKVLDENASGVRTLSDDMLDIKRRLVEIRDDVSAGLRNVVMMSESRTLSSEAVLSVFNLLLEREPEGT